MPATERRAPLSYSRKHVPWHASPVLSKDKCDKADITLALDSEGGSTEAFGSLA